MPRIVDRLASAIAAGVFRDDAPILADHDPIGISMDFDRAADGAGAHRVLVIVKAHETGF